MVELGRMQGKKSDIDAEIVRDVIENNSVSLDTDGGVKVLSEKTGSGDNFYNDRLVPELVPVSVGSLSDEFRGLLQMN